MNGYEGILQRIVADAKEQAEALISGAKATATTRKEEAESICEKKRSSAELYKAQVTADIAKSRRTVAELDLKKELLGLRRGLIDSVYSSALVKINSLPSEEYLSIISGMLRANASNGDIVVICKKDKELITPSFIASQATSLGINLTLSEEYGDFSGGIILRSSVYDKNLSLDVELAELREETESTVASMLFAE